MDKIRKQIIEQTLRDSIGGFLYYDRKEDEDLPRGVIEQAVKSGVVSVDSLVDIFREELENYCD